VHLLPRPGQRLLELGLVVDVERARVLDPLGERVDDGGLDPLEAVLEVDRRDRGLEDGREDVPAAGDALELVGGDVAGELRELLSQAELFRDRRAALAGDDVRADLREASLGRLGEAVENRASDRELEDAVPEELQPLVRLRPVFRPRRVGEDLLQPVGGQLRYQAAELGGPGGLRLSPSAR
jgi:hypothetical protein